MIKTLITKIIDFIGRLLERLFHLENTTIRGGSNMAKVTVTKDRYTTESLYQWDKNQVLEITGLSLPSVPEIHFATDSMDRAIVRQASMNAAGVVTAYVPNSLLQKPYKIKAYVCIYQGDSFKSEYLIEIPVVARAKPDDYSFEDDAGEIYSFNALENYVNDTVQKLTTDWAAYVDECEQAVTECKQAVTECGNVAEQAVTECKEQTEEAINGMLDHTHEFFGVTRNTNTMSDEQLNALLSEQFDAMDFCSNRRLFVPGIIGINATATGGACFITLYKGSDYSKFTSLANTATAVAYIVATEPGGRVYRCKKYRMVNDASWSELIWENPPLVPGTEYATDEFIDGRRVYTMLLNMGNLPNNDYRNTTINNDRFNENTVALIVRVSAFTSGYRAIPYNASGETITLGVNRTRFTIATNYDASASTWFAQVWYLRPAS